jgi:hypothetical protein
MLSKGGSFDSQNEEKQRIKENMWKKKTFVFFSHIFFLILCFFLVCYFRLYIYTSILFFTILLRSLRFYDNDYYYFSFPSLSREIWPIDAQLHKTLRQKRSQDEQMSNHLSGVINMLFLNVFTILIHQFLSDSRFLNKLIQES